MRKFSCPIRVVFIELGGMVERIVVDLTAQRSPIPSGGLEIKLKLYFRHTEVSLLVQLWNQ